MAQPIIHIPTVIDGESDIAFRGNSAVMDALYHQLGCLDDILLLSGIGKQVER